MESPFALLDGFLFSTGDFSGDGVGRESGINIDIFYFKFGELIAPFR
jgi:hypothetical protein